jgi:hypothetical protein
MKAGVMVLAEAALAEAVLAEVMVGVGEVQVASRGIRTTRRP